MLILLSPSAIHFSQQTEVLFFYDASVLIHVFSPKNRVSQVYSFTHLLSHRGNA